MFNAKNFGVAVIVYAVILGVGSQIVVHNLDEATKKQCLNHDWPAAADQVHRDWCIGNGYRI